MRVYTGTNKRAMAQLFALMMVFLMAFAVVVGSGSVRAYAEDEIATAKQLHSDVYDAVAKNDYKLADGGSIKGSALFTDKTSGVINASNFERLSSKAQNQFIKDINTKANSLVADEKNEISSQTVENWFKELQSTPGAGSQFLQLILENTKPDFVTANRIYKPFSGPVGVIMGVIAVVGMGLLGIVMVSDIMYISLPPLQALSPVDGGTSKDGKADKGSFFFSSDAKYAVKTADTTENGTRKQALGIYLKRRVPMLILLGICLMYLISGSIFRLIGMILDLLSGFLGS